MRKDAFQTVNFSSDGEFIDRPWYMQQEHTLDLVMQSHHQQLNVIPNPKPTGRLDIFTYKVFD